MIPDSFIQELKYRCDIETVLSSYMVLKRRGRNLTGLCPFHSEKTPSFTVYPENQSFYCFGCGAGGDVVTFIKKIENLEYVEALRLLASRVGMALPEDAVDDRTAKLRGRILEINRTAARFFYDSLYSSGGEAALAYLHNRGLRDNTIRKFGVGYAPAGWDNLLRHLESKGYTRAELEAACVITKGKNGSYYDLFRNRVMFPIIDLRGGVIGFGGRALEDRGPKYLNSPDTLVFKKSRNLYAMNYAKATKRPHLILCEGYMDVIAVHQAGFDSAVATLGTSLTAEQARLVSQYTKEVVIAYDSDGAGQTAAKRAINLFDETGVRVRVLAITGAKDPDEFIKKYGPARFDMLLSGSAGATEYNIGRLKEKHDLTTADGRVAYLKELSQLLADINNPIERDVYAAKAAQEVGVDKAALLLEVEAKIKQRNKAHQRKQERDMRIYGPGSDPERSRHQQYAVAEEKLLLLLLKHPDCYPRVAAEITEEDFVTETNRNLYRAISQRLAAGLDVNLLSLSSSVDEAGMAKLSWLLASESSGAVTPRQADDYINRLRQRKNSLDTQQIASMDDEAFVRYISTLASGEK